MFWFIALSSMLWVYLFIEQRKKDQVRKRNLQLKSLLRENVLKKKLESYVDGKVKVSKRHEIETLYLQAGIRLNYTEHVMFSSVSSLFCVLFAIFVLNNLLLMILFAIIGYLLPKQIISWAKNIRIEKMEKQIGPFMQMVIKRYEVTKDFSKALELTADEFKGEEPLYKELKQTVLDLRLGMSIVDALQGLARRTGNPFLKRMADYYEVSLQVGTEDVRKKLLNQAYLQYKENQDVKRFMKRELAGVKREAYILTGSIPLFVVWQAMSNPSYVEFMTQTLIGKVGTAVIVSVFFGSLWFVANKISAPLDE